MIKEELYQTKAEAEDRVDWLAYLGFESKVFVKDDQWAIVYLVPDCLAGRTSDV